MIYMEPEHSQNLIRWVSSQCKSAVFLTYEQILPDDSFGRTMISNLEVRLFYFIFRLEYSATASPLTDCGAVMQKRGCPLKGLRTYPDIPSQIKRFKDMEFQHVECYDMNFVHQNYIDQPAKTK